MPRSAAIALAAAGLLGLGGCGSDSPTVQEFLAEADAACARTGEAAVAIAAPVDLASLKDAATRLSAVSGATADSLGKLDQPSGNAASELVASIRSASRAAGLIAGEAEGGNLPGIEHAARKTAGAFADAEARAKALGSAECATREAAAAQRLAEAAGPIAKAAFVAEADRLCAAAGAAIDAIPEPQAFADVKGYLEQTVAIAEKLTNDIKAKPAPSTDKARLDEAIAANDAALAKIKEAQAAAAAGDEAATTTLLDETIALSDAADAKADAYGFKDCGSQGA